MNCNLKNCEHQKYPCLDSQHCDIYSCDNYINKCEKHELAVSVCGQLITDEDFEDYLV
jgi:hypothetical protein